MSGTVDRRSEPAPALMRHGKLRRRSPVALLLKIVGAGLAVLLFSGASVAAITAWRLSTQLTDNAVDISRPDETFVPLPQIGAIPGGFNILIVGSDTREGQAGIGGSFEDESANLNDVNILLHVSQDQTNAVAVSFPRDLVVDIPECVDAQGNVGGGVSASLNEALYNGGLGCAVFTIENLTGLDIQFAGEITFYGVINMSDAIGGVDVCVDGPVIDEYTGLVLPNAGTYTLQGIDALAFLRSRHGVGDGSDLTRISSQQVFLSSLVRKLQSESTLSDVGKLVKLANAAAQNLQLSTSMANIDTMVSMALALKDIPPQNVTFVSYPVVGYDERRVAPDWGTAAILFDYIRADQPFGLEQAGDDRGSYLDPNAPPPAVDTADPSATPPPAKPIIPGLNGQTAADHTCSISNY